MFTGWLPDYLFQRDLPITLPLPYHHERTYRDGSDGNVRIASGAYWTSAWRFIDCGIKFLEGYGIEGQVPVLNVTLVQPNVFGVLLFDWFIPPAELKTHKYLGLPAITVGPDSFVSVVPIFVDEASGLVPTTVDESSGTTVPFSEA